MILLFNDTATTEIYALSLHDALPIFPLCRDGDRLLCRLHYAATRLLGHPGFARRATAPQLEEKNRDRKSTRLNSSHANISHAVFCLKKKQIDDTNTRIPL